MARIYLDWAASAPPLPDVVEGAARIARESYGNPSSLHAEGRAAEALLASARERFARVIGARPESVVFTSGGTESNNLILSSLLTRPSRGAVVASGIEHSSVYEPITQLRRMGFPVTWVAAESNGRVSPEKIAAALRPETVMVTVMLVNNETGAVQPIREIAAVIREFEERASRRIHLHCDAVQALGKIPMDCRSLDVDSAAFSGHKLGALRGGGALYLRRPFPSLFRGGGQEGDARPGTENLPAIWAIAEAAEQAEDALTNHSAHARELKKALVEGIQEMDGASIVPEEAGKDESSFSPYILSVAFPPLPGEVLVRVLNDAGCAVSTGSACASRHNKERRVLSQSGVDATTARSAIRISTGYDTRPDEVAGFLDTLRKEVRMWNTPLRA